MDEDAVHSGGGGAQQRCTAAANSQAAMAGRGSHSFTFQLNVIAFCGIGGASRDWFGGV